MSDSEEYWSGLAKVSKDDDEEHLELIGEGKSPGWKVDSNGLVRLNSEGYWIR